MTKMTDITDLTFAPDFQRARAYFQRQAAYAASPLETLATPFGTDVLAKNETERMGLGAFKALGAPYAVALIALDRWRAETGEPADFSRLDDPDLRAFAARLTFVCASAGNHGMGVAAGARMVGAAARIHLAETVPQSFVQRLEQQGAKVLRSGAVYEESVAAASADAQSTGAILLADGTWPGYTELPKLVMEGYCVIAEELRERFEQTGKWPSHVYLQAGVGGLAAAMAHMIRLNWAQQPELIVVEPDAATCLRNSHLAGEVTRAEGPDSAMGRLDCKEVSIVAWSVLERCRVRYVSLSEAEGESAAQQMTALGIETTPSGGAGYGGLCQDVKTGTARPIRPLVIVSEGVA